MVRKTLRKLKKDAITKVKHDVMLKALMKLKKDARGVDARSHPREI